ncbi:MAG: hypothetical protein U5L09_13890 [Bacteroidales bacterium]|nr:hypothetical protein [Bacteroidales bacterium]
MHETMRHMDYGYQKAIWIVNEQFGKAPVFDAAERVLDEKEVQQDAHYLSDQNPHGNLAKAFNQDLLQGNRKSAYHRIMKAVESGVPVQDLYLHVFSPRNMR